MADDAQSIRSLNWRELFPFLHIFRSFGIAIHPSKIVLGFALLVLVYGGGRVLDWAWPSSYYAAADRNRRVRRVSMGADPDRLV